MSAADEVAYFASKMAHHRTGEPVFFHASPSRWWVGLHGTDDPIVSVRVREWTEGDPPSSYFGWLAVDEPDHYMFIWPSEGQLDMCFPYGPKAEERCGKGRKVNLIIEEVSV